MRVLVTGATGFLGQHLLPLLASHQVRVLVLPGDPEVKYLSGNSHIEIIEGDITVPSTLTKALYSIQHVIHLAGLVKGGQGAPLDFMHINAQGTANLAKAALAANVEHLVYSSSTTIYGSAKDAHEDTQLVPAPGYPLSKIEAETALRETLGHRATILRFPLALGSRDSGFMRPTVMKLQRAGQIIIIGSGHEPWSVISAHDAARALVMALDNPITRGQTYNVTGARTTNGELLHAIGTGAGCTRTLRIPMRIALAVAWLSQSLHWHMPIRDQVIALGGPLSATSSRFEKLGFSPQIDWHTALSEGIEWSLRTIEEQPNPA